MEHLHQIKEEAICHGGIPNISTSSNIEPKQTGPGNIKRREKCVNMNINSIIEDNLYVYEYLNIYMYQ